MDEDLLAQIAVLASDEGTAAAEASGAAAAASSGGPPGDLPIPGDPEAPPPPAHEPWEDLSPPTPQ
eukprot:8240000-Pyramimonas_sp.AAC.1